MTLHQCGVPALSVNAGAGNHQWLENDWERLDRFSEILIFFDNDEAGDAGAQEIVRRLGLERCKRVRLPAKDANEFLQQGADGSDFWQAIKEAKPLDPEELRQASDFINRVKSMFYPAHDDECDPVLRLDKDLGWFEFRRGELTVWTGYNGHGKSLMLSQVLLGLMQQGERVMVFSGEMTPERQLKRCVKQAAGLDRPTMRYIDAIGAWLHDKLWFFNVVGSAGIDRLLTVFLYGSKRYGMRHFVIDSLMMTDVPEDGPGSMTAQKEAVRKLCDFARRNGVHVHLVAHPRKGADETKGPGKLDVAGSSKITDGADNVFTVWSARKDENDPSVEPDKADAKLELQKQRNGDTQHYTQWLWFNKAAQQFATTSRRLAVSYVPFVAQEAANVTDHNKQAEHADDVF
jgi:twinkle protein